MSMIFDDCFNGLNLQLVQKEIIDACLQALSLDLDKFAAVLADIANGESSGFEVACIYLEEDCDDSNCPDFSGVCFNYFQEYAAVSKAKAQKILSRCIHQLEMDYEWPGMAG